MKYSEPVRQVKDILGQGRSKGRYFRANAGKINCCVHGAAQRVCNSQVTAVFTGMKTWAAKVQEAWSPATAQFAGAAVDTNCDRVAAIAVTTETEESLMAAWRWRPDWVRVGLSNLNLHYLLGMFGITPDFNDDPDTTLEEMLQRLERCAVWAEQHEEFLQSID